MKKVIFILTLLIGVAIFTLREPLILGVAKWQISSFAQEHLGQPVDYKDIAFKDNRLILEEVSVAGAFKDQAATYHFSARQIEIGCSLEIFNWNLTPDIIFSEPKLVLEKQSAAPLPLDFLYSDEIHLFKISQNIICEDGVIELRDRTAEEERIEKFYFRFKNDPFEGIFASLSIFLEEQEEHKNIFTLSLTEKKGIKGGEINLRNISLSGLTPLFHFFTTGPLQQSRFTDGVVDGGFTINFPSTFHFPSFRGGLSIKECTFENNELDLSAKLEALTCSFLRQDTSSLPSIPLSSSASTKLRHILSSALGTLDFVGGEILIHPPEQEAHWGLKQLSSNISFLEDQSANIIMQGFLDDGHDISPLILEGELSLKEHLSFLSDLKILSNSKKASEITLSLNEEAYSQGNIEIQLKNFDHNGLTILQNLGKRHFPDLSLLRCNDGIINASCNISYDKNSAHHLTFNRFSANNLELLFLPSHSLLTLPEVNGTASLDITVPHPFETLAGEFRVADANLTIPQREKNDLEFTDIQGKFHIKRGMFHDSTISTRLGNIEGSFSLDWYTPEAIMSCSFQGKGEDFALLFPEAYQRDFIALFHDEQISLHAKATKAGPLFHIYGGMDFDNTVVTQRTSLAFDFDLEKVSKRFLKIHSDKREEFISELHLFDKVRQAIAPHLITPSTVFASHWLAKEVGIAGLVIRNGHFRVNELPLERYVSPFIKGDTQLTGVVNVRGSFDHRSAKASYELVSATLENSNMVVKAKKAPSTSLEEIPGDPSLGHHYFDFYTLEHFGILPVADATYFDKKFQFSFERSTAKIFFTNKQIHILDIQTSSDNISFAGDIKVNFLEPKHAFIDIRSHKIVGDASSIQKFCLRFLKEPFTPLPIGGNLISGEGQGYFKFDILPDRTTFLCNVKGKIDDVSIPLTEQGMLLKGISGDVEFDYNDRYLNFEGLTGICVAGDGETADNYDLKVEKFSFSNLPKYKIDFDVLLHEKGKEIARFIGQTSPNAPYQGEKTASISFDNEKTHIGGISPNISLMTVKNWSELLLFEASPNIGLSSLIPDAKRLYNMGLHFLKNLWVDDFQNIKMYGNIDGKFLYNKEEGSVKFTSFGEELVINQELVENFFLSGYYTHRKLSIDQLQLDKLSLSAELESLPGHWKVHYLGVRYGKSLFMNLEGDFFDQEKRLRASLNLLEANLEYINEYPKLKSFVKAWAPKGFVRATGSLQATFLPTKNSWDIEIESNSSIKELELKGIRFQNDENIDCRYSTKNGFIAKGIDLKFYDTTQEQSQSKLKLEKLHFMTDSNQCFLEGLNFSLYPKQFHKFTILTQDLFTNNKESFLLIYNLIQDAKTNGPLEGKLDVHASSDEVLLALTLRDGAYNFAGIPHHLRDFSLNVTPQNFHISTKYLYQGNNYLITFNTDAQKMRTGTLVLKETGKQALKHNAHPLTIHLERDYNNRVLIDRIEGTLLGLEFQTQLDRNQLQRDSMKLSGHINIDFQKALPLFPAAVQKNIMKAKLGKGYTLSGSLDLPLDNLEKMHYKGKLTGKEFEFLGYQFSNLATNIEYIDNDLQLSQFHVEDEAVTLSSDLISLKKSPQQNWIFQIPLIKSENLRPSRLKKINQRRGKSKPLIVQYAELRDLQGDVSDPKSFLAKGYLSFHSTSNKNFLNIILAVPNDIISRIGLDFNLLTPVMGRIEYELKNEKIYLLDFKDVYSKAKRSKFYLAEDSGPSFMDLNGNLDIKIKMKQYNIIFKIAELFTIYLQGSLEKPLYTLQRQEIVEEPIADETLPVPVFLNRNEEKPFNPPISEVPYPPEEAPTTSLDRNSLKAHVPSSSLDVTTVKNLPNAA